MATARRGSGRGRGQWKGKQLSQDPPLNSAGGGGGDIDDDKLVCELCHLCDFLNEDELFNHKIKGHPEFYEFECGQCDKLFGGLEEMENHFKSVHMMNGEDEEGTAAVVEEMTNLEREVDVEVAKSVVDVNTEADNNFEEDDRGEGGEDYFGEDGGDMGQEDGGGLEGRANPFKCDFCPKSYPWKSELTIHLRSHTGEKPYTCEECGQSFSVYRSMVDHQKRHNKKYEYFCEVVGCGKGFVKKQDRDRHEVKGHVPLHLRQDFKNNQCDICGKNFANSTHLKIHVNGVHGKGPGYPCHLCGKSFGHQSSLRSHLQSKKHGGTGLSFRNKKKTKQNATTGGTTTTTTSLEESSVKIGGNRGSTSAVLTGNLMPERQRLPAPPPQTIYPNAGLLSQFIPNFQSQQILHVNQGYGQGQPFSQQGTVTLQDAFQMASGSGGGGGGCGMGACGNPTIPFS